MLLTDWWWFQEVGYTDVFTKPVITQFALGIAVGLFTFLFLSGNFWVASKARIPWIVFLPQQLLGRYITLTGAAVKKTTYVISLLLAFFIGLISSVFWQEVLLFMHQTPFGQTDPIFAHDISFYLFTLPILGIGLQLVWFILLLTILGCGIIYALRGSFGWLNFLAKKQAKAEVAEKNTQRNARIHMAVLFALFLATIAAQTYLGMYDLLTRDNGAVFGAAFTDVTLLIPFHKILAALLAVCALATLLYGAINSRKPLFVTAGLTAIIGVAMIVMPPLYHQFIVAPNELVKETPFIKHNITATREAFGLQEIAARELSGDKPLTAEDIADNDLTIKNVRLWDRGPLLSTFSQIQEIRTYYEFTAVDNDRYVIDGQLRQIMLSPRELSSANLPNKNWINEHLIFTHGYGTAAGPVNQVTEEGLPVLFVKNLPPVAEKKELAITRPEIYYGELANDHIFVKTKAKEFDYPKGDENVSTVYAGEGGVPIDSFVKKSAFALRFNSLKMLLSEDITGESRVMYYRTIKERMEKSAPFLTFDKDPYSVIVDGKIYWIADAYTISRNYPYAKAMMLNGQDINYIRNSVKVVIDAYNGTITYYQVDQNDPIINAYAQVFPGMFRPINEMPTALFAHIRYPEDIFTLQTNIYSTYHMGDPEIFYNKEDQWDIPAIAVEGEATTTDIPPMAPRHMIMKLPGQEREEYILMLPFIPRGKDNMAAWMVARNDQENYGKLQIYQFPKQKLIYRQKQIMARINQDAEIARQISLWDQRGSQVIQGPLLVIPIEESLLYVRPLYLKAESGKIPELKRVIVAYENKIAMEPTLEAGLGKIFGTDTTQEAETTMQQKPTDKVAEAQAPTAVTQDQQIIQANQAYDAAMQALRDGNWTLFGEEIQKVGEILKK